MQSTMDHIEALAEKATQLAATRARIWKLKAAGSLSEKLSALAAFLIVLLFGILALLMFSIWAAFWIGSMVHSTAAGFLIMGGFYLFTGFLFYLFRKKWLRVPVMNRIISILAKEKDHATAH